MQIIETISEIKSVLRQHRANTLSLGARSLSDFSLGLVPTMGFLHQGHLSLVSRSQEENDLTIVWIFVNPAQFGPNMDFNRYPRDLERDANMLRELGVDIIFAPRVEEIYPKPYLTWVDCEQLTTYLDGASRPGYFRGICTVVLKFFNIIQADRAYFGQKDIQQARVIQQMVKDLNLDTEITIMPIIRESDGLAMSSRNAYLSSEDRARAPLLSKALFAAQSLFEQLLFEHGEVKSDRLISSVRQMIEGDEQFSIDYIEVVDSESMQPIEIVKNTSYLALAVNLNGTRLIDNVILAA